MAAGYRDVELLFYHYHALPPMLEHHLPEDFRAAAWRWKIRATGAGISWRRRSCWPGGAADGQSS